MNSQLAATLLVMLSAGATGASAKSLLEFEERHIDKIAQLSARERCTILFEVGGYDEHAVGYAKDARIHWIDSTPVSSQYRRHSALSPDGLRVAFVSYGRTRHCRIDTYDIPTAVQRELIEVEADPGEISWSWDNTRIAFFERGSQRSLSRTQSGSCWYPRLHSMAGQGCNGIPSSGCTMARIW
jgi:hypothetical protein